LNKDAGIEIMKKGEKGLGKGSKRIRDKCEEESKIGHYSDQKCHSDKEIE